MKKRVLILISILIIIFLLIFLIQFAYKNKKSGNNINTSQEQIVDTILNMEAYSAKIEVRIISNKNENKYLLEQKCILGKQYCQEVIKPENIKGTKIEHDGNNLKIENTEMNLSKIYENYKYLEENYLDLTTFIKEFKEDKNKKIEEDNNHIVLKSTNEQGIKQIKYKELIIDKKSTKPIKLEIKDVSQNRVVYILYNDIEINSLGKNFALLK